MSNTLGVMVSKKCVHGEIRCRQQLLRGWFFAWAVPVKSLLLAFHLFYGRAIVPGRNRLKQERKNKERLIPLFLSGSHG